MKSILYALQHLTRLPLPNVSFDEASCGRATAFFPLAGVLIGALMAALVWTAGWYLPVHLLASLLIILMVVLTGGIHLDGFMDSIDGLFSGRQRENKLEIMRDSRVGAFGVISLICLLLLKYSLLAGIPAYPLIKLLVVTPVISRWNMTLAIYVFPYARQEGLGAVYKKYCGVRELLLATVLTGLAAGIILGVCGGILMLTGGLMACLVGGKVNKELGGLTGDIYGLINELSEVLLLLAGYVLLVR